MTPFAAFLIGAIIGGTLVALAAWVVWPSPIDDCSEPTPRRRKWRDRDPHEGDRGEGAAV